MKKTLIILNNIGSPDSHNPKEVRKYLQEFLMDPLVIQIPWLFRWLLVYGIISIFRTPKAALKYKAIWLEKGSPLILKTLSLKENLEKILPNTYEVKLGMRYQNPSIRAALKNLSDYDRVYFLPLYPQYAESTTKSALQKFQKEFNLRKSATAAMALKSITIKGLKPFWQNDLFIQTWVSKLKKCDLSQYEGLLFSYHGLPESQLRKNSFCEFSSSCCEQSERAQNDCYRAQCFQTTKLILNSLKKMNHLPALLKVETTFQSRLGRGQWISPYTDEVLQQWGQYENIKKVLVVCPAFVTDCLETLEEIQIENKQLFIKKGGQVFDYVSSLNDDPEWVRALASIIQNEENFTPLV